MEHQQKQERLPKKPGLKKLRLSIVKCAICRTYRTDFISLHRFPSDDKMRIKWIQNTGIMPKKSTYVCSKHFTTSCFTRPGRLVTSATPSIDLHVYSDADSIPDDSIPPIETVFLERNGLNFDMEFHNDPDRCAICRGYRTDFISLHRFPLDDERRTKWIRCTGIMPNKKSTYVCSKHFTTCCFTSPGRLLRSAIPSVDLNVYSRADSIPGDSIPPIETVPILEENGFKLGKICRCAICRTCRSDFISLHRFPLDDKMKIKWIRNTGIRPKKTTTICSRHFTTCCFTRPGRLLKSAIPSIDLSVKSSAAIIRDGSIPPIETVFIKNEAEG